MTYATTRESWGGPSRHGGGASVLSASVPRRRWSRGLWRPEGRRCGGVAVSEIETKTEAELAIGDVLTGAESELRAQGCLLFKEVEEDDEEDE